MIYDSGLDMTGEERNGGIVLDFVVENLWPKDDFGTILLPNKLNEKKCNLVSRN